MTRPKRSLTVIGDSETVKRYDSPCLGSLRDANTRGRFVGLARPAERENKMNSCTDLCTYVRSVLTTGGVVFRGSAFLKKWMAYLEDHADLRYPDVSELGNG